MSFENDKKVFLSKTDKSKKQSIDKDILNLVNKINSKPNYYTTSSCSGRIVLIKQAKKKNKAEWLLVSHKPITLKQITSINFPKETVWLKQEDIILHIVCKTLEDAKNLLNQLRKLGFKRTGIISINKKITIEIKGNEYMDVPIAKNNKLLVDNNYLKILIKEANSKLRKCKSKIKILTKFL